MILADSSIWIDYWRNGNSHFEVLLVDAQVLLHPHVIGELCCGNIKNRPQTLAELYNFPSALEGSHQEVLELIETKKLFGLGVGFSDVHLIAPALLTGCPLWTLDRRLREAAVKAGASVM